jgi:UDP-GlcNAc:undecaprenyl-phosphate/decaprenyl-phosphate GlcNAc-1-phosphate transferase
LLWGFGATAPALMIAALSIVGSTKIATTVLVLIVPFLDGTWAIIRRLSRKQSPFFGDREHFHHLLMDDLGWSKGKIATFYWAVTALLAIVGLTTSDVTRAICLAIASIAAVTIIAVLNFRGKHNHKEVVK